MHVSLFEHTADYPQEANLPNFTALDDYKKT